MKKIKQKRRAARDMIVLQATSIKSVIEAERGGYVSELVSKHITAIDNSDLRRSLARLTVLEVYS